MEKKLIFKKSDGTTINDVNQYVKDWLIKYPFTEVTVGCDSQAHSRSITYSVVIVMHVFFESKETNPKRVGNGAHVISATIIEKDRSLKGDLYNKLWAEAVYTVQAAQMIDSDVKNITIHLDFNSKEGEYSNILYQSGLGYCLSHGFAALGKPFSPSASHAADHLCR